MALHWHQKGLFRWLQGFIIIEFCKYLRELLRRCRVPKPLILICDDDLSLQLAYRHSLRSVADVISANHGDEALVIVKNRRVDVLLLDINMRREAEGLEYLPKLRELDPEMSILVLSGVLDFDVVKKALLLGASDYLPKSLSPEEIHHSIQRALQQRSLVMKSAQQARETKRLHKKNSLIGSSNQMESIRKIIAKMRASTANVVIYGETGTGKEVVARLLRHEREDGSLCPFVSIDSATIHRETAESILFGHEKGAFTGADKQRKGIFEEADGGIVYFDELANMSLEIQSKLLRVLEEKEVTRLGSARAIPVSFRVVCASNKNLEAMVRSGALKEDLYQRLTVLPINLPPLRDRLADIPELVDYFCGIHSIANRHLTFTQEAMDVLMGFAWPGNVRELSNLVAYLYAMKEGDVVDVADLPAKIKMMADPLSPSTRRQSFYERIEAFEKRLLMEELEACGGNVSKMAQQLGIDRSHLYSKLKAHGIQRPEVRASAAELAVE